MLSGEEFVRNLRAAGVKDAFAANSPEYSAAMGRLFTVQAAMRSPLAVVQPSTRREVAEVLRAAREEGIAVTTRGGGLSTTCAADEAIMIDLSVHLRTADLDGTALRAGGGVTMGEVNARLATIGRFLPVGVAPIPGLGLATQGGVGHFTRPLGLTLDHIQAMEIVTGRGEEVEISESSTGPESDLWWAARGCAPALGVVTSITFRSRPWNPDTLVNRSLFDLDAFPRFVEWARGLPDTISASAVLGVPPDDNESRLLVFVVGVDPDGALIEKIRSDLARCGTIRWSQEAHYAGSTLPPFDPPAISSKPPGVSAGPPPSPALRIATSQLSPFLRGLDGRLAEKIVDLMRKAPTRFCRLDFQHAGGALSRVAPAATSFFCRDFEWNAPIIGAWEGIEPPLREPCKEWVRRVWDTHGDAIVGTYSTEIRPGTPEAENLVALAFGENLPRLRELKSRWDPDNLFRKYYPLSSS